MSNEELAELSKNGDERAFNQLWEQTRRLYYKIAYSWYVGHRTTCEERGYTYEDIKNVMPMALYRTVQYFDASKGNKIGTIADYFVKHECRNLLAIWRKREPIISLDEKVNPNGEEDGAEYGDLIPDPNAERSFALVEQDDLRRDLESALDNLHEDRARIIRLLFFGGLSTTEAAEVMGIPLSRANQLRTLALQDLRKPKFRYLREYIDLY